MRQIATAMKAHLVKYLDTLEKVTAVGFLTRRMATAARKDRSDISFLTFLHDLPHKVVLPNVRQAVLKWALDDESDTWFLLRRHWTRASLCACGCGLSSKFFPNGFFAGVIALCHIDIEIKWMRHAPHAAISLGIQPLPPLSPPELRHERHLESATALLNTSAPWLKRPCVLCGQGENSVQPLGPSRRVVVCVAPKRDGAR